MQACRYRTTSILSIVDFKRWHSPGRTGESRPVRYRGSRVIRAQSSVTAGRCGCEPQQQPSLVPGRLSWRAGAAQPPSAHGQASLPLRFHATAEANCRSRTRAACYAPQQFRVAYGIAPLLDRGTNGNGETVVLQEFARKPGPDRGSPVPVTDIRQDLALFDAVFGLPTAHLRVDTSLAGSASPWWATGEEVEDTEIVHTVAPDAAIRVVLIPRQTSPASAVAATDAVLRLALWQGGVVSIGPGSAEHCYTSAEVAGLNSALQAAQDHHVTVVSSSGDDGAAVLACSGAGRPVKGVGLYASDPRVLTAGGTSLEADRATGTYISEPRGRAPLRDR